MKLRKFLFIGAILCMSTVSFAQDVDCETEISIYREAFKQWDGKASTASPIMITNWRKVFINCPSAKERTLTDGTKIVNNALIRSTKDAALKEKYIDTLVMVYDARIQYFPKSGIGNIKGRMGLDLMAFPSRMEQAYNALKEAIEIDGNNSNYAFIDALFSSTINMVKAGKLDESAILDAYSSLMDIVEFNIKRYTEEGNEKLLNSYTATKGNLEGGVQPYANCEDLVRIFQKKFDAEPDNVELLNKIATVLSARNCDKTDLYLSVAIKLHKLNPSPESAYFIGKRYLADQEFGKATSYLLEATKSDDVKSAEQAYKYLAKIMLKEGKYEQGRTYARKAIDLDKTDGEPYMIIGHLYASSAKECGGSDAMYSKVAFWAAVDKFAQAKKVDKNYEKEANDMIKYYSQQFPTIEDIFMRNYEEGKEYTVECWINEKTIIRALKTE